MPTSTVIVEILRQEFGRGNEFARKSTCRTTDAQPENLIKAVCSRYYPLVAVTMDILATGNDIKPVETV